MKIVVRIEGDIEKLVAQRFLAGERAVKGAIRDAGVAVQADWRQQIGAAGLGTRLQGATRLKVYPPDQPSMNAVALVYSKAPKIIGGHDRGPLIRSKDGFWLAIPLPAAGKGPRGAKITPGEWERRRGLRLRFVYRRTGPSLLVADGRESKKGLGVASRSKTGRGRATVPIFLLVPQVKLPKRLNLYPAARRIAATLPGLIAARWRG
jgi:hypothetical protein